MTDYRALGAVSTTLRSLLRDRMELPDDVSPDQLQISIGPPLPQQQDDEQIEPARLNLFLYRVAENPFLKNQDMPGRGHPGTYGRPPLSLDLHYLLTGYGTREEAGAVLETLAHMLLGSAMRVFHDHPVITEALLDGSGQPILHPALRGEFEAVKLALEPVSLEDLSKVWTALTVPYRLSAAYSVSVVQIESQASRTYPKLVGEPPAAGPRVIVTPLRQPQIMALATRRPGDPPESERAMPFARIGDTLILKGAGFDGEAVRVLLGAVDASPAIGLLTRERIEVEIPEDVRLQPGAQPVAVTVGAEALPQAGFRSNAAVLMLVPHLAAVTKHATPAPRRLRITGSRVFSEGHSGETLIGNDLVEKEAYLASAPGEITLPLPDPLPAWPARCLLGGPLAAAPAIPDPPDLQVTIGGDGPHTVTLVPTPADIAQAAQALERALHTVAADAFRGARVAVVAGSRLAVVPGGLLATASASGPSATALRLTPAESAANVAVLLSGSLAPFPTITTDPPRLQLAIDGTTHLLALNARPASLSDAANLLEQAIRTGPGMAFAGARVATPGQRLLVIPGIAAAGAVQFEPVAGTDETTARELQLAADYSVRVRVNGAENIDGMTVALP